MANEFTRLGPLGQPFGSPSRIFNVPAPVGSERAGQTLQQGLSGIGSAIGAHFAAKKTAEQEGADHKSFEKFIQQREQFAKQGQPGLEDAAQAALSFTRGEQISVVSPQTGQPFIAEPQLPQFQSPKFRSIAQQLIASRLQQQFAPAQAPTIVPQGGTAINRQGQPLFTAPAAGFKVVDKLVDDPASSTSFSVEQFDQAGNSIGRRSATQKEVLQGVPEGALQKPTQTKIEKDIIDLTTTLAELEAINKQVNDDFLTFRGKGRAFFTGLAEKAEIPVGKAHQQFLSDRTEFFADSKRVFLEFRKFITGVAGGIEEFKEIAKATIDPEKDSPTQFKAKMKSMSDNAKRTRNVLLAMRNSGVDPQNSSNRKRVFSGISLGSIPLDVSPSITLDALQVQPNRNTLTPADLDNLTLEQLQNL